MTRVLNQPLAAHDVNDLEELVWRAIHDATRRNHANVPYHVKHRMASDLVAIVWIASQDYKPETGLAFSTYAYRLLRWRIIDWIRTEHGSTRNGRQPELSLDYQHELDNDDPDLRTSLEPADTTSEMDPAERGDADLRGLLNQGSSLGRGPIPTPHTSANARAA